MPPSVPPSVNTFFELHAVIDSKVGLATVAQLLDAGADETSVNTWGTNADSLIKAVDVNRLDILSLLLDRGVDINAVGGTHGTALATAAYTGLKEIVSLLLDQGADINAMGGKYGTALTTAACMGHKDLVSLLLDRGADISVVGSEYGTPLAWAIYANQKETVSLLLDRGADINTVGGKYGTALATAAYWGREKIMSLLLDQGADIDAVGGEYGTALATAAYWGRERIMSLLLDRGADININVVSSEFGTALAWAVYGNEMVTVSLLLDRGADINVMGGKYGTVLATAVLGDSTEIVSLLLDRGADMNLTGSTEYGTPLTAATHVGYKDRVLLLLDRGAGIDVLGSEYGTALATAVYWNQKEIVSLLLDRGADIIAVGGTHGTALATAAYMGNQDIVSLLLNRGADININVVGGENGTALDQAIYGDQKEIVSLLLDRGADINAVGGTQRTALATAAYRGSKEIVSLLLDRGAEIDIKLVGSEFETALSWAVYGNKKEIVLLLLDRGADINMVGGKYGTALATAVHMDNERMASLLLGRGADINVVVGEYGTALATAVYMGDERMALLLLGRGADVNAVGGCYQTASGVYPSALDAARSEGSKADPTLLKWLEAEIRNQNEPGNQPTNVGINPVDDSASRPPFPMPHTPGQCCALYASRRLQSSSFDILSSTIFCAGDNITPEQADLPCRCLNQKTLFRSLTALVGLPKDISQAKRLKKWIRNDIRYFVSSDFDFGLAYAAARVAWKHFDEYGVDSDTQISIQRGRWHKHAKMLDEARSQAIYIDHSRSRSGQELIKSPYSIMPRRLWDLKSNRVVEFRMLHAALQSIKSPPTFWAVSHSWTSDMHPVSTSINERQWPIPLPKGISLEGLRSELSNLGAEYIWLDVVCLRQQSVDDSLDQLKREEWRLDVPTIGNIYRAAAEIVRYFNGLGISFSKNGWDDPRHWLRRAWTLQEIATENTTLNGGIPRDKGRVILNTRSKVLGKDITLRRAIRPVLRLATEVDSPGGCGVYELAREMTNRYASQPVDKLSGLFYLLRTTELPCYNEKMTSENFWMQCFHLLPIERKIEILFDFPYRGSDQQWFPTWAQIMEWPERDPDCEHARLPQLSPSSQDLVENVPSLWETSLFIRNVWAVPHAVFYKTEDPNEYEVKIENKLFGFYSPYLSQKPIDVQDQAVFTLAIVKLGEAYNWVVCRAFEKRVGDEPEIKVLKKLGVLRTDSCSELLVGGESGVSMLRKFDCLFV